MFFGIADLPHIEFKEGAVAVFANKGFTVNVIIQEPGEVTQRLIADGSKRGPQSMAAKCADPCLWLWFLGVGRHLQWITTVFNFPAPKSSMYLAIFVSKRA